MGDRRRGGRARPGQAREGSVPADRAARPAPGQGGGGQRGRRRSPAARHAAFAIAPSACSWTWASTRPWRRCSAIRLRGFPAWFAARSYHLASMPGVARRAAPRDRLDGGALLRAGGRRARPARPSTLAGQPARGPGGSGAQTVTGERTFREGRATDLRATYELAAVSLRDAMGRSGVVSAAADQSFVDQEWPRQRPLLEFIAAQPGTGFWVCEDDGELVGYVRVARFTGMDELTEIAVAPSHAGAGIGKGLLARAWPEPPTPRARPGRGHARHAGRPDALHPLRRDAGGRSLAPAPPRRGVPGAPLARDRLHRAGGAPAHPGPSRGRVEAPRARRHRARAARPPRVLRRARAAASPC